MGWTDITPQQQRVLSDANLTQETIMNARPTLPRPSSFSIAVAAALATLIAIGLLSAVAVLFQHDGSPLEQLVAAESACTQHVYVSERQACVRDWLAAGRVSNVATK